MLTSTIRKVQYTIAYPFGATFAITFRYWAASQIYAVLSFSDGTADQTLVQGTDYTLSAPGVSGTLTKVTDWNHAAIRLTIYREIVLDQETDYRNGEAVDMDLLEQDFDLAVARGQELAESIARNVSIPITDPAATMELPSASDRMGKFLAFDSNPEANPIPAAGVASVPVSGAAATILDDATISAILTTLGFSAFAKTLIDDGDASTLLSTLGVSAFIKTLIDDADYLEARGTLKVHSADLVSGTGNLQPNTNIKVSGQQVDLTLPASASEGDRIVLEVEEACRILQSDANHGMSYLGRHFTTKGAAGQYGGYLIVPARSRLSLVYKGSGLSRLNTFAKLTDPPAPNGNVNGLCSFSFDGVYLAIGTNTTPFVEVYKRSGDSFSKLSAQTAATAGAAIVSFSMDGTYLAVGCGTTPFIEVYKRTVGTDTFTKLGALTAATAGVSGISWTPDGVYMAVAVNGTPFVEVYKRTAGTDTFTKLGAITAASGTPQQLAFSPDGTWLAICSATSPFIDVYRRTNDTFTKLTALPAALGSATEATWSTDSSLLLVNVVGVSPYLDAYKRYGDTFFKLPVLETPDGVARGVTMDPLGVHLAVPEGTTPWIAFYRKTGESFTKLPSAPAFSNPGSKASWSGDGVYCAVAQKTGAVLSVYKTMESITKAWIVEDFRVPNEQDLQFLFK